MQELLDSRELREALFPILFAEGPTVLRDRVFIWRELEEQRWKLIQAAGQSVPAGRALAVGDSEPELVPNESASRGSRCPA